MIGNGIDMYDLIPDLKEDDKDLYSTEMKFWVGVIEGMYPSPPVPRRRTNCYSAARVYIYCNKQIFAMDQKDDLGNFYKCFYKIPNNERKWIQK